MGRRLMIKYSTIRKKIKLPYQVKTAINRNKVISFDRCN